MNQREKEFPIFIVLITYIIIWLMYLITYSQKSYLLWGFFIVERLIAFSYEDEIDHYLSSIEIENINSGKTIIIGLFSLLNLALLLYTPFKYPRLFVILIVGEVIDCLGKVVREKSFRRK